ncbi:MAG: hypothetical protein V4603_05085 [Pseudomonadota bacterium]
MNLSPARVLLRRLSICRLSICRLSIYRLSMWSAALLLASPFVAAPAWSQPAANDSAFLACARFADRAQRIACLEDALEAATRAQGATAQPPTPPSIAIQPAAPATQAAPAPRPTPAPAAPPATATVSVDPAPTSEERSLLERVRAFGQKVTMTNDDNGTERLHDSITDLQKRNDLLTVTLSSGQVWRQEVAKTLNLRVGDEIEIYQEGIGLGYRMATPRLNGFIRVERVR